MCTWFLLEYFMCTWFLLWSGWVKEKAIRELSWIA